MVAIKHIPGLCYGKLEDIVLTFTIPTLLLGHLEKIDNPEEALAVANWEAQFQEHSYCSGLELECLDLAEDWLVHWLNDSEINDSLSDMNSSSMNDVLIDVTGGFLI